jgi:hypothetical protein
MQIGLLTDSLSTMARAQALEVAAELGIQTVEIGLGGPHGGWSPAPHADLAELLTDPGARIALRRDITSRGLRLEAFNAAGNPLHPVDGTRDDHVLRSALQLAEGHPHRGPRRRHLPARNDPERAARRPGLELRGGRHRPPRRRRILDPVHPSPPGRRLRRPAVHRERGLHPRPARRGGAGRQHAATHAHRSRDQPVTETTRFGTSAG